MQLQIIESNRGGKIALHGGHSYNQKQTTINCIHWRCTKYYKTKCPAILKTGNENLMEIKVTHNHDCDPGKCKTKEIINQVKRRAQFSTLTVAMANEISEISCDYAVQLPMPKKTICCEQSRKRQKEMSFQIPAPTDRHFDVPDEFAPFLYKTLEKIIMSQFYYLEMQQRKIY